jgi:hypothetical protein
MPLLSACTEQLSSNLVESRCTKEWFQAVEEQFTTGDGKGHGPDLGSFEWRSVIEFKLGIRGSAGIPDRRGEDWCEYINELVFSSAT